MKRTDHLTDNPIIDLRTDAMTPPTDEMWEAMRAAELGWQLLGEDTSVLELEALGAELLGKEAGLFVPTCSMANLLALMSLGERGTQVIFEANTHMARLEYANSAYITALFARLIEGKQGVLDPSAVDEVIRDAQYADLPRTSVVCLENSHNNAGGTIITPEQTAALAEVARRHGAAVHLDGARIFNSAAALGINLAALTAPVDTVAVSLNKGLCAPSGALLCGSRSVIDQARTNRKRLGAASMHKDGILAAAGIVALTKMIDRIGEDNRRARHFAERLVHLSGLYVDLSSVQTNIVLVTLTRTGLTAKEFVTRLSEKGILTRARSTSVQVRFVTHRMIEEREVERAVQAITEILR